MNALELRRRVLMMAQKKSRLPSEYQEVEYLESAGAQYINTKVQGDNSNQITVTFRLAERAIDAYRNYVINVAPGSGRTQFSYSKQAFYGWGSTYQSPAINTVDTNRHDVIINKNAFTIDGVEVYSPTSNNFIEKYDIFVFAANSVWASRVDTYSDGLVIYALSVINYDTKAKIREFIPCYRKSDHQTGMYDLVTKTFFTNQGTGEFIVGADVN